MESLPYIIALYIHIGAGIMWIGALIYIRVVLLPTLNVVAPTARGPVLIELGPRSVRFALRVAEITIVAGLVMMVLIGRVTRIEHLFTTQWGLSILLGMVGALVIYGLGRAVTAPVTLHIVETLRQIAAGEAQPDAPAYLQALADQQRRVLNLQVLIAAVVVFTMAAARFS